MILKGKKISFIVAKAETSVERNYFSRDGECLSCIRPFIELGVEDRPEFRLYYLGIGRFLIGFATRFENYKPIWEERKDKLSGVLMFKKPRRKKHVNSIGSGVGNKPPFS